MASSGLLVTFSHPARTILTLRSARKGDQTGLAVMLSQVPSGFYGLIRVDTCKRNVERRGASTVRGKCGVCQHWKQWKQWKDQFTFVAGDERFREQARLVARPALHQMLAYEKEWGWELMVLSLLLECCSLTYRCPPTYISEISQLQLHCIAPLSDGFYIWIWQHRLAGWL